MTRLDYDKIEPGTRVIVNAGRRPARLIKKQTWRDGSMCTVEYIKTGRRADKTFRQISRALQDQDREKIIALVTVLHLAGIYNVLQPVITYCREQSGISAPRTRETNLSIYRRNFNRPTAASQGV